LKPQKPNSDQNKQPMKQHNKWLAGALAVVSGLIMTGSAQAQGVTGTQYLSNMDPANVGFFNQWADPSTVITSTPTGLEINALGGAGTFSSSYYALPAIQIQGNNPGATQVTFTFNWNSGNAVAGVNVLFSLDDSNGGAADYYGTGYNIPTPGLNSYTFPLQAGNLADFQAGDVVAGINFQIDPGNVSGNYDITYSSITLGPTPEPATFALPGLGAAGLLAFRRRNK
jgi:hypothetical protein